MIREDVTQKIYSFANQAINNFDLQKSSVGMFTVLTGNQWIERSKNQPAPKMLFSQFWHESELCILFSDTNLGKSILAVQIADSISKGTAIHGFKNESTAQPVAYFDFEMGQKQFEGRYSEGYTNHYTWHENFYRIEINSDSEIPNKDFEECLYESLEETIIQTGAKILIIDNLTYLKSETEKAKDALPLMKQLKALKSKHLLSILALAHTPKRDLSKPITRNDLQGSKMLINFCDSAFCIGESSNDKNIRYLKQIKQRNTEQVYDSENVVTCQILKENNFLGFEFLTFARESDHLRNQTEQDRATLAESIKRMKLSGKSYREISAELGISFMTAKRVFDKGGRND